MRSLFLRDRMYLMMLSKDCPLANSYSIAAATLTSASELSGYSSKLIASKFYLLEYSLNGVRRVWLGIFRIYKVSL